MQRALLERWSLIGNEPKIGPVSYKTSDESILGSGNQQSRQFSEHTQELIDEEVARIFRSNQKSEQLLREHRVELEKITKALLEHEELGERELTDLIGPSIQSKMNPQKEEKPSEEVNTATSTPSPETEPQDESAKESSQPDESAE